MELILQQPYNGLDKGETMNVPASVGDLLVKRGVARPAEPTKLKKPAEVK